MSLSIQKDWPTYNFVQSSVVDQIEICPKQESNLPLDCNIQTKEVNIIDEDDILQNQDIMQIEQDAQLELDKNENKYENQTTFVTEFVSVGDALKAHNNG